MFLPGGAILALGETAFLEEWLASAALHIRTQCILVGCLGFWIMKRFCGHWFWNLMAVFTFLGGPEPCVRYNFRKVRNISLYLDPQARGYWQVVDNFPHGRSWWNNLNLSSSVFFLFLFSNFLFNVLFLFCKQKKQLHEMKISHLEVPSYLSLFFEWYHNLF